MAGLRDALAVTEKFNLRTDELSVLSSFNIKSEKF